MRLINDAFPDYDNSKLSIAADKIFDEYQANDHRAGTQLVFLDLATPKGKSSNVAPVKAAPADEDSDIQLVEDEDTPLDPTDFYASKTGFDAYADLKRKLVEKGVPAERIGFIHDFNTDLQKADLFAKVNRGDIRILLGSTSKMGEGMNVQKRLVALHNLDAPWKPSDLEQRNGRIIRQGNEFYFEDPAALRFGSTTMLPSRPMTPGFGKSSSRRTRALIVSETHPTMFAR
jgi:hypothetical protein